MIGLVLGVGLIVVGTWSEETHKHQPPSDIRTFGLCAILLGGILVVAWLGGLMRF